MKDTTSPSQVQHRKPGIIFDPNDLGGMHKLMDAYGDSSVPFPGKNEAGEDIWISIFKDRITIKTHQRNGWVRLNTYWRDGIREETFDGRWRSHERSR